jgi:hypothetical protein
MAAAVVELPLLQDIVHFPAEDLHEKEEHITSIRDDADDLPVWNKLWRPKLPVWNKLLRDELPVWNNLQSRKCRRGRQENNAFPPGSSPAGKL